MVATTLDGVILHDVFASRPAVGTVAKGAVFSATDTKVIYQSDGAAWNTMFDGSGFTTNPLTTTGDIIYSSSGTTAARLAIGSTGKFLTAGASTPAWGQGPLTTTGDLMLGATGGTPTRLAVGGATTVLHGGASTPAYSAVLPADLDVSADNTTANATTGHHGLLLKLDSSASKYLDGSGAWSTPAGTGFANPMTTKGDLIIGDTAGAPIRKAVGTDAYVLTADAASTGGIKWAAASAGFSDPMTTRGDIIIRNAANATARLAIGSAAKVLTSDGTDVSWSTAGGSSRPYIDTIALDGTYGTDFDEASLPGGRTRPSGLAVGDETYQSGDGSYLRVAVVSTGGASDKAYYISSAPAGDCQMVLSFSYFSASGSNMTGPGIADSSGNGVAAIFYQNALRTIAIAGGHYSSLQGTLSMALPAIGSLCWMRLRRATNDWYASVSLDGINWSSETSAYNVACTAARSYFGCYWSTETGYMALGRFNKIA